jgi:hypothetical protein
MYPVEDFRASVERLVTLLRACRVRFYLTGGAAAVAYGDPRMTQDIDLVLDGDSLTECLSAFLSLAARNRFLLNESVIREALRTQRQFQLIDMDLALKIDLYPKDLVPGALDRAVELEVFPQVKLPVAARPDLALSKLIWIDKGSHKSRRDLRQILLRATESEHQRVRNLADQFAMTALLDEVLAESDEIDA